MHVAGYIPTHAERRHYAGSGETGGPQFRCSHAGCDEYFFEQSAHNFDADGMPDPMHRCECGKWFCPEHVTALGGLHFCEDCCRCQFDHNGRKCGNHAVALCDDCGDLLCKDDLREQWRGGYDTETGPHEDIVTICKTCRPLPPLVITQLEIVQMEAEHVACPF